MSVTCWTPVERAGDAAAAISAASATNAAMTPLIAPIVDDESEKLRSEQPTPYEALAVPARASLLCGSRRARSTSRSKPRRATQARASANGPVGRVDESATAPAGFSFQSIQQERG